MRRRRWRTVVLWGGCTVCALIAVLFVASGWWSFVVQIGSWDVEVFGGACAIDFYGNWFDDIVVVYGHGFGLSLWNTWSSELTQFPLWLPFLIVAIPMIIMWGFVPKFPRGHCRRCGYDLTGNTSGVCPECGVEVQV